VIKNWLFDLYVDYLICSTSYTTATGLSKLTDKVISHDKITRLLSSDYFTNSDLWKRAKSVYKWIEADDGILVIDDSIEEKPYTDENEIIAWHWDHKENRSIKGINFVSALYVSSKGSIPVAVEVVKKDIEYIDKKTEKKRRKASVTKQELYRKLVDIAIANGIKFKYVLNDSWFSSVKNFIFLRKRGKHFIVAVKCNRNVALSDADLAAGDFVKIEKIGLEEGKTVSLEGVDFPIRLTRQVFKNEDASTGVLYLACSDLELTDEQIAIIYKRRWKVERYHQSLKANTSLAKSPTKTPKTQLNHLFACLCAYIKLEEITLNTQENHFSLKDKIYIAALRTAMTQLQKFATQAILPTETSEWAPA